MDPECENERHLQSAQLRPCVAGARPLRGLLARYDNDIELALAAYHAGEAAVDRCGRCVPRYRETQDYVPRVLRVYQKLRSLLASG